MHPNQHFTPGTRVRVRVLRTRYGWEQIHVGRTGTVIRQLGQQYSYGSFTPTYEYLVQMDGLRREQVTATALETVVENAVPTPGTRVKVTKTGRYRLGEIIDGLFGTVEPQAARYSGLHPDGIRVKLDEPRPYGAPRVAVVEEVAVISDVPAYEAATAEVGDRVLVTRQPRAEKIAGNYEGEVGKVTKIDAPHKIGNEVSHRYYHVKLDSGPAVKATKLAVLPKGLASGGIVSPPSEPLADWERELLSGSLFSRDHIHFDLKPAAPAEPEVPILVDIKRAQSLKLAQEILGEFPDIDELIKLAAYVENGIAEATVGSVYIDVKADSDEVQDDPDSEVSFTDGDGDRITLDVATSEEGSSTILTTNRDHDGVYIRDADVERIVSYLRARKGR